MPATFRHTKPDWRRTRRPSTSTIKSPRHRKAISTPWTSFLTLKLETLEKRLHKSPGCEGDAHDADTQQGDDDILAAIGALKSNVKRLFSKARWTESAVARCEMTRFPIPYIMDTITSHIILSGNPEAREQYEQSLARGAERCTKKLQAS